MAKTSKRPQCPMCKERLDPEADNAHRPFCSERCRLRDLSRWLRGEYSIAGEPVEGGPTGDESEDEAGW